MFRRSYSPMAFSSNVLYFENSIVKKCLFRRLDILKSVKGIPMFLKSYSPIDDQTVHDRPPGEP